MAIPISILIPARNEAKGIKKTLDSLDNLKYPKENLQILIANDNSTDNTLELLIEFAQGKSHVSIINIPEKKENEVLGGKTRVLAILAQKAFGKYLFFTDADIELPANWITGMLSELEIDIPNRNKKQIGVLVGVTGMKKNTLLSVMQALEWLIVLTACKSLSDRNIPTTGMGNNMAVLTEAYKSTGGYEKIGFSLVEDYALYKEIIKKGYDFRQVFNSDVLAFTVPPEKYFEQRNRWIKGAITSNAIPLFLGIVQALSIPIYLIFSYFSLWASISLFLFNFCTFTYFAYTFERKLKLSGYLKYVPLFSLYLPIAWLMQLLHYGFTKKVNWKGRTY